MAALAVTAALPAAERIISSDAGEKAITTTFDTGSKLVGNVSDTIFDAKKRREVGSDVDSSIKGIGSLGKEAVVNIGKGVSAALESVGIRDSHSTKINKIVNNAKRRYTEAFNEETNSEKKTQAGTHEYMNYISRLNESITPSDQVFIDSELKKLQSSVTGGCDECGGKGSKSKPYINGIIADAVTGGDDARNNIRGGGDDARNNIRGGGGNSIYLDLAIMILGCIFLIALVYCAVTGVATSTTKNIKLITGSFIIALCMLKFLNN